MSTVTQCPSCGGEGWRQDNGMTSTWCSFCGGAGQLEEGSGLAPPAPKPDPAKFTPQPWHYATLQRYIEYCHREAMKLVEAEDYNCGFFESDEKAFQEILDYLRAKFPAKTDKNG